MSYPRNTSYQPGAIVGARTILGEPEIRTEGHGAALRMYWPTRCACGREAWVQGTALRRGLSDRCNPCAVQRRARRRTA